MAGRRWMATAAEKERAKVEPAGKGLSEQGGAQDGNVGLDEEKVAEGVAQAEARHEELRPARQRKLFEALAASFEVTLEQVEATVELINSEATVPFITRYRKAQTGGLDEDQLRSMHEQYATFLALEDRRIAIIKSLVKTGNLTDKLRKAVEAAATAKELEDLYRPFKPTRRTLAAAAREIGLGPLGDMLWHERWSVTSADVERVIKDLLADSSAPWADAKDEADARQQIVEGASHIVAEHFANDVQARDVLRELIRKEGRIEVTATQSGLAEVQQHRLRTQTLSLDDDIEDVERAMMEAAAAGGKRKKKALSANNRRKSEAHVFEHYFDWSVDVPSIKGHQVLAINRGESMGHLKAVVSINEAFALGRLYNAVFSKELLAEAVEIERNSSSSNSNNNNNNNNTKRIARQKRRERAKRRERRANNAAAAASSSSSRDDNKKKTSKALPIMALPQSDGDNDSWPELDDEDDWGAPSIGSKSKRNLRQKQQQKSGKKKTGLAALKPSVVEHHDDGWDDLDKEFGDL
eukprot:TRINITY_DN67091_c5_g1_i1.p1 TRINITY_DN67091_c5_g1~~TRINITY_DN67091_c5_g1_i1.p1  ORF type:complete len:574 (+),score=312.92 TRINITY_DN67091_c5_g1_i1:153-1724(+)